MIDATPQKPLDVSTDGTAGGYIMVPLSQLEQVQRVLRDQGVRHTVDENVISLDDEPEVAFINLDSREEPERIQRILDGAA
jgi:hypothetical protein